MNTVSRVNFGTAVLAKAAGLAIIALAICPAALAEWKITYPPKETAIYKFAPVAAAGNSNNVSQTFLLIFRDEDDGTIQTQAFVTSGMGGSWNHTFTAPSDGWVPGRTELECRNLESTELVQVHPLYVVGTPPP